MEQDENPSYSDESPFSSSPSPLHAKRIVNAKRESSHSATRVKVSGAEMSNIYRAYHGRLNMSYWRRENNERVCYDAMDLLDQIVIFRGCEPSVIISYIALVREVYLHACENLKEEDISLQERKTKMLEQWKQIERHFAKIKYVMLDCWPVGNESDLMAAYVSIALLYSLYKEVCDESIIRQCYEAAERARQCGSANLSESQFNEVQQYCDTIENIFFLRRQRSTLNGGRSQYVNNASSADYDNSQLEDNNDDTEGNHHQQQPTDQKQLPSAANANCDPQTELDSCFKTGRVKDGPAILAEYGRSTAIGGKLLTDEKIPQKRLRPSDFEVKNAQKRLKYQNPTSSTTILSEFEALLTARNTATGGDVEFPRPSDLKLNRNLKISKSAESAQNFDLGSTVSDSGCGASIVTQSSSTEELCSLNSNMSMSDSIQKVSDTDKTSTESQSVVNQDETKETAVNIGGTTDTDIQASTSSQVADANYHISQIQDEVSSSESGQNGKDSKNTKQIWPKLESYVNELVEKIMHSVTETSEQNSGKRSRRNSETILKTDTVQSTVFTSINDPVSKQRSVVMLNDENNGAGTELDGVSKNISIRTRRILKESIDRQTENVIVESMPTAIGTKIDSDSSGAMRGEKNSSSEKRKPKVVVIEGYTEMELSKDDTPESPYDRKQTLFENVADSNLYATAKSPIASTSASATPKSVTPALLPTSGELSNKLTNDGKGTETCNDKTEKMSEKSGKVQELVDDNDKFQKNIALGFPDEMSKVISSEEGENMIGNSQERLQEVEPSEKQHITLETLEDFQYVDAEPEPMDAYDTTSGTADKKIEENQKQTKHMVKFPEHCEKIPGGQAVKTTDNNVSEIKRTTEETVSSTVTTDSQRFPVTNQTSSQQESYPHREKARTTAYHDNFRNFGEDAPMQKLYYSSDMPSMEITSDLIKNLITTLEKFDATQAKSRSKMELFESYMNFEPASCCLQRVPEFDARPLSTKPLMPENRMKLQAVLPTPESTISDMKSRQECMLKTMEKPQDKTVGMECRQRVSKDLLDTVLASSGQTRLKDVEATNIRKVQIEHPGKVIPGERYQVPLTSSAVQSRILQPQVTAKSDSSNLPRTGQSPVITELEVSKSITSKHKNGTEESSEPKLKSILKKTFAKTESLFTKNDSKHQQEAMTRNTMVTTPEVRQISLHRPQMAPPRPPQPKLRREKNERSEHPSQMRGGIIKNQMQQPHYNTPETSFTSSGRDKKDLSFTYQTNTPQQIDLPNLPESVATLKRTKELGEEQLENKPFDDTMVMKTNKEQRERGKSSSRTAAIWNLADKLISHKKDSTESTDSAQASKAPDDILMGCEEVIQVPHFDAKAEFERRLSGKKKRRGEVPVIVKNVNLKPGSKGRLSGRFTEGSLISSTSQLRASEKPNFNFIINKDENDSAATGSNTKKNFHGNVV